MGFQSPCNLLLVNSFYMNENQRFYFFHFHHPPPPPSTTQTFEQLFLQKDVDIILLYVMLYLRHLIFSWTMIIFCHSRY